MITCPWRAGCFSMIRLRFFFLALLLAATGCTHKPEITVIPVTPSGCDSINITYTRDIKPIFSANCYSCHATAVTLTGGLDLEDTASLKNYLKNGFRGDGVYGSKLYHCMLHSSLALPMPPTYVVDSCSLKKVHNWLKNGASVTP